ncbi:3-deoxy-manno-octulosonate cytidylyltransferase [Campylobacter coli]|nr:3-deoxy-manno-octulosonate cytidylyltransferase [Campylobacter lari]ECQ7481137.1 3-deoxy-manno-octulosonate cytidylyltransferase [Campylobacter coli]ECQ8910899.1 3-deoxy-manno-octulosonate cytidylyltransferase [Campylobacter coli]ECR3139235.1 3-deoxy-manno-octulosonate cytidylyltransferase [Campylobacter coli]EDO8807738.1 3-deoxy-manno-octulosonate cytidylyltransferase [Campylobacter coli]
MKVLGVIPARYSSTRFPGKPLADIMGKPMVWWVYQQAKKSKKLSKIIVATDDKRIVDVCDQFYIPNILTQYHESGISRIHEVSENITADLYVQINGDEPLINAKTIDRVIPKVINGDFVINLICKIKNPSEALDLSNIKIIFNDDKRAIYASRTPIPTPYKCLNFDYYKHLGILAYTKSMLDFFVSVEPSKYEKIEGLEILRFIEYGKRFDCIEVEESDSLSVDTPKDLERVINFMKLSKGNQNTRSEILLF